MPSSDLQNVRQRANSVIKQVYQPPYNRRRKPRVMLRREVRAVCETTTCMQAFALQSRTSSDRTVCVFLFCTNAVFLERHFQAKTA